MGIARGAHCTMVQLFMGAEGRTSTLDVDGALTVGQLKDVIEDESFIPADLQRLSAGGRDLTTGTLEDNELADGTSIELLLNVRRRRGVALQEVDVEYALEVEEEAHAPPPAQALKDARAREVDLLPRRRV